MADERLSERDLRRVAAEAGVDPRTAERVINGAPTMRATRTLVVSALRKLGFEAYAERVEHAGA